MLVKNAKFWLKISILRKCKVKIKKILAAIISSVRNLQLTVEKLQFPPTYFLTHDASAASGLYVFHAKFWYILPTDGQTGGQPTLAIPRFSVYSRSILIFYAMSSGMFCYLNSECDAAQLRETVDLVKSQPVVVVVVVVVVIVVAASSCRCLPLIQTRHDIPPSS